MEIVLVMGYPASGKSTWAESNLRAHRRVNRDSHGDKSLDDMVPIAERHLDEGAPVVLDNTYPTRESRASIVALAKRKGVPARVVWLDTTIEEAQYNAAERLVRKHGRLPTPDEIKKLSKKDPNTFGPSVLFRHRKLFEEPSASEGFSAVDRVRFARAPQPAGYTNKALLLDYDGTLRRTKSGEKYPRTPDDIELIPGRVEVLRRHLSQGYKLLGVSNQGAVAKGDLTVDDARACFARTNALLGLDIEVSFCPHEPAPINCWCRKPMPGMAVDLIERHKLDRAQTLMIGDMTSDRTFASRAGVSFVEESRFFA